MFKNTKNFISDKYEDTINSNLIQYFTLPHVKSELKRYANGFKGEAKESKKAFFILAKYMNKEEISGDEKKLFKDQIIDILKGVGVVLPIQLIPIPFLSTILLIVVEKTMLSMGIHVLPSSFYEKEDEINEEKKLEGNNEL